MLVFGCSAPHGGPAASAGPGGRSSTSAGAGPGATDAPYRVLVFTKTAGFRHDSIPAGIQAVRDLAAANNFTVDATEDATAFAPVNLARYQVVIFLNTTGDVLDAGQQAAFVSY